MHLIDPENLQLQLLSPISIVANHEYVVARCNIILHYIGLDQARFTSVEPKEKVRAPKSRRSHTLPALCCSSACRS